jgi:hypothetical protein
MTVFLGSIETVRVELVRVRIVSMIHMDIPEVIRHERAFIDSLASNSEVICKVSAESGAVADSAERLASYTFNDGHFVLPCGHRDRGEPFVNWFVGVRGIRSEEILDFGSGFVFPLVVDAQLNESPAC